MKKAKLFAIIAAAIVLVTLIAVISSCAPKTYSIKSYINSYEKYESSDTILSKAEEAEGLRNAILNQSVSGLFYFTSHENNGHTKHMIYDPVANKIIATYTDSPKSIFEIKLYNNYSIEKSYYTVVTSFFSVYEESPSSYTTDLYSCDAEKIASAKNAASAKNIADMIYFDGNMYGVKNSKKGNSKIELLFEYSPLADLPLGLEKHGKYYYDFDDYKSFSVYNDKLELISNFTAPQYAEEGTLFTVLENGNVLIQYIYTADDNSDDYTFIYKDGDKLEKFYLVTLVVNHKTGKAKEIKSNYIFGDTTNLNVGNSDFKYTIIAEALAIENKRLSTKEQLVFIDSKGNGVKFEEYNGLNVSNIVQVSENRWKLITEDGKRYLLDDRAALIGDITNANTSYSDKFMCLNGKENTAFSGKIYDYSLNEIFDASNLTYCERLGSSVIYTNSAGEYLLYSGSDSAKTIVAKDSGARFLETLIGKFYVLYTGSAHELYNANGEKLISITCNDKSNILNHPFKVMANDGACILLSVRLAIGEEANGNGDTYTKTVYYIIK